MTDLPSRTDVDGYVPQDAITQDAIAVLDAYVSGRLVDREAIDPCPGDDSTCPGHDHGDPCHYQDDGSTVGLRQ